MIASRTEEALGFEVFENFFARSVAVETCVDGTGFGVHMRGLVHHGDGGQVVTLADCEVVRVVRGGDFDGSGAEIGLDPVVGDDGDFAVRQRQLQHFADEVRVALVERIHGHGDVAEHSLRAGGGDGEEFAGRADDRVANFPELAQLFFVGDFEVGDGGLAARAPVDDVGAAIDEAIFVEADEGFAHGDGKVVVHGEVLAGPVDGVADALHRGEDGAAVVLAPLPDALDKGFATEGLARGALGGELALDEHLRGDSGVVCAGKPEGGFAEHAVPADENVRLGVLEHVPHMQIAGDVGRGQQDGEGARAGGAGRWGPDFEEALVDPVLCPALFNGGGIVGFGEFAARFGGFVHLRAAFEGVSCLLRHSLFTI